MKWLRFPLFNLVKIGSICLSIFLTFGSQFSLAFENTPQTCSEIAKIDVGPIRDQGDIGWCYANAAADLLSYEFNDKLEGKLVSDMHVAMTFTKTFIGENFFEGGSAFLSVKAYLATQNRLCLQDDEDQLRSHGLKISLKNKLKQVMLLKSTYDAQTEDPKLWNNFFNQWMKIKRSNSYLFSMGDQKLLELLQNSSAYDFPNKVADKLCSQHSKAVVQKDDVSVIAAPYTDTLKSLAVQAINRQLDNQNIVAYAYRASVLIDPHAAITWDSAHMSVLVGRKWNSQSKQCEYLIRNSWGSDCKPYNKSPIFKNRCEAGYVWIPEDIMKKSMIGVSYFDKPVSSSTIPAGVSIRTAK
jgi:hypothetical protein